jgi:signal peptidase II
MRNDGPISLFSALRFKTRLPLGWYRLAIVMVIIDQLAKLWATMTLQYGVPVVILPVFNFTLQHNTGAAFSFLHDAGGWQRWLFSAIAIIVGIGIAIWMARLKRGQTMLMASLALILGGALGNVVDRLRFGYVVDFISVHYADYYFPAFNVADSAITIGAGLLLLDMLLHPQHHNTSRGGAQS